jgi:nitrogen fixation NifU-like protein
VRFTGDGCAISIAATSLLTDAIKGKTLDQVQNISAQDIIDMLGISVGPARLKCALLAYKTLKKTLGETHD